MFTQQRTGEGETARLSTKSREWASPTAVRDASAYAVSTSERGVRTREGSRRRDARTPNGWPCCSTARPPIAIPSASRPDCVPHGCGTARPRSRTSTTARRAGSTKRCSSSWPPAAGSPSTAGCWLRARTAGASRGYPARSRRRLAATVAPSTTRACRVCSPISISRMVTAASRGCSGCWSGSISLCSTIGDPIASPPANDAISWRSSRIAMAAAPF